VAAPQTTASPLDLGAFQSSVWTVAESATIAVTPPPPPPLKLQLLGIVREGGSYRAVLYDPEVNKVRVVTAGEAVQGMKVERIAAESVSIMRGDAMQVLALKAPRAGAPP
jgi:hypothetical protein